MLSARELIESREKPPPELPSFGIKDFQPDGSLDELNQIQNSLSEIKNIISHERVKMLGSLSQAVWQPELRLAHVTNWTGSHWSFRGHTIEQNLYIYPEEALYLLETGALEIFYKEVSLSVERAYFVLLAPQTDVSIEKYRVYSHLHSHGYKVLRHSPENTVTKYEKKLEVHKLGLKLKTHHTYFKGEKRQECLTERNLENRKKLKLDDKINFPINYNENDDVLEVFKKLQIFQPCDDKKETSLNFDYDIYSESSTFKKSCLQLPSYRIIVHRSENTDVDIKELCRLPNKYKDEIPVIHAVVFPDYIAYYEINSVILPDNFDSPSSTSTTSVKNPKTNL